MGFDVDVLSFEVVSFIYNDVSSIQKLVLLLNRIVQSVERILHPSKNDQSDGTDFEQSY